jgi:RNA polymerase sigma-70 factor (ECF subfamily)
MLAVALDQRVSELVRRPAESEQARTGELDQFLRRVERRAFRMAEFAVGEREDALELVQEAMLGFVRRYADKPAPEWTPLFYRVLESRITDFHRRRQVRGRIMSWLRHDPEHGNADPISQVADANEPGPPQRVADGETRHALIQALRKLPRRQRQAFLLRVWEGLDVAETARAMGVGEGSVKTHLSRALAHLRDQLEALR